MVKKLSGQPSSIDGRPDRYADNKSVETDYF